MLEWTYYGAYDAFQYLRVDSRGTVLLQRGTYHSHSPLVRRADLRHLALLDNLQAPMPSEPLALTQPFVSDLVCSDGRHWRWLGKFPDDPQPLRQLLRYLDGLG